MQNERKIPQKIHDMSPAHIEEMERRMRPGQMSVAGFLGEREKLKDIVNADISFLKELGITHQQIAHKLEALVGKAGTAWIRMYFEKGNTANLKSEKDGLRLENGRFLVKRVYYPGCQECPWDDDQMNRDHYDITNTHANESINFSGLLPHLIADHHFFEGVGTRYRLDPAVAHRVLELKPGVDYTPRYKQSSTWDLKGSGSLESKTFDPSELYGGYQDVFKKSTEKQVLAPGITAYVDGNRMVIIAQRDHTFKNAVRLAGIPLLILSKTDEYRLSRGLYQLEKNTHDYIEPD